MNRIKSVYCWYAGHDWDKSTGYKAIPWDNAKCNRCGVVWYDKTF